MLLGLVALPSQAAVTSDLIEVGVVFHWKLHPLIQLAVGITHSSRTC